MTRSVVVTLNLRFVQLLADCCKSRFTYIDSIIIIPGVSTYENIYTKQNLLYFSNNDYNKSIAIEFISEGDLDRFFAQMMRENKINQILGDYKGGGSSS